MTHYHDRTLQLLGINVANIETEIPLVAWAQANSITIPQAYLEWAQIDRGGIISKYSNQDDFPIHQPEIIAIADGRRGLMYCRENQGCFDKIVLLDDGDDPPVLMSWLGDEPWFQYSQHFSDEVFCQIFDWQYALEFDEDDVSIAYDSGFRVSVTHECEKFLSQCQTLPQTKIVYDSIAEIRYRRTLPCGTRLLIDNDGEACRFTFRGLTMDSIHSAEDEFLQDMWGSVVPPNYTCVVFALYELDRHLRTRRSILKLATLFVHPPQAELLKLLQRCVDRDAIEYLRTPAWDNPTEPTFTLYIPKVDAYVHIRQEQVVCWRLYSLDRDSDRSSATRT